MLATQVFENARSDISFYRVSGQCAVNGSPISRHVSSRGIVEWLSTRRAVALISDSVSNL
jgi:hypothetical protein